MYSVHIITNRSGEIASSRVRFYSPAKPGWGGIELKKSFSHIWATAGKTRKMAFISCKVHFSLKLEL